MEPTPQSARDAVNLLARYLQERGYAECIVSHTGGCAFRLRSAFDHLCESYQAIQEAEAVRVRLTEENHGLRAELESYRQALEEDQAYGSLQLQRAARLEAEVSRLRSALRGLLELPGETFSCWMRGVVKVGRLREVVRQALGDTAGGVA